MTLVRRAAFKRANWWVLMGESHIVLILKYANVACLCCLFIPMSHVKFKKTYYLFKQMSHVSNPYVILSNFYNGHVVLSILVVSTHKLPLPECLAGFKIKSKDFFKPQSLAFPHQLPLPTSQPFQSPYRVV